MQDEKSQEREVGKETNPEGSAAHLEEEVSEPSKTSYLNMFERVGESELDSEVNRDAELDKLLEEVSERAEILREGNIIKGKVYEVNEKEVILNVGFKSEGSIPIDEFSDCEKVKKGDEFDVYVEKMENQEGLIVLSKEKADFIKAWDDIKNAYVEYGEGRVYYTTDEIPEWYANAYDYSKFTNTSSRV